MSNFQMLLDAAEDDRCQQLSDTCKGAEVVVAQALSITNMALRSELKKRVLQLSALQQKHEKLAKKHTVLVYEHGFTVACNKGLHRELAMYSHLPRGHRRPMF